MASTTLDTVRTLLESLLEETSDTEVRYKLRTALQLLDAHEQDIAELGAAAAEHDELSDSLRELGYLD
jgi:hypothetical protein